MPIDPGRLVAALEQKRNEFKDYEARQRTAFNQALGHLDQAGQKTGVELREDLEATGRPKVGAKPSDEWTQSLTIPPKIVPRDFPSVEAFVAAALEGVPLATCDGSQLDPGRETSLPVGVAHVYWNWQNNESQNPQAERGADTEIVTPRDFEAGLAQGIPSHGQLVALRRFELEQKTLRNLMTNHPGTVAVIDGSLLNSFAVRLPPKHRARYDEAINQTLILSKKTKSPIVAYIATSHSNDLVTMLSVLYGELGAHLPDSILLRERFAQPGARTPDFESDREDGSQDPYVERIHFCYLNTSDIAPSRLEYPAWVAEKGLVDRVASAVMASAMLRTDGYPQHIHVCHEACTLGPHERDQFTAALRRFADRNNLSLRLGVKGRAKEHSRASAPMELTR
jgi:hypothetical protein